MLQQETPDDFVIATGHMHSVREFVEAAFGYIGKKIRWEGSGVDEVGIEEETEIVRVKVHPKYYRPTEVVSENGHRTAICGQFLLVIKYWVSESTERAVVSAQSAAS